MYKQIQTLEKYNILLKSGMFWEFHQTLNKHYIINVYDKSIILKRLL